MKKDILIRRLEAGETVTLGSAEHGPSESIALGHISAKEFNRRYKAEGWSGDPVSQDEVNHEYRRVHKNKITRSNKDDHRALAVSTIGW
jgi:hypothetical protein